MDSKYFCLGHAQESIHLLFVGQRMVVDTNIRLEVKNKRCEYVHPLTPRIKCDNIAGVKIIIFARNEEVKLSKVTTKVRSDKPQKQTKL